uniref:Uncharacterized protein n=1 Tax=Tetranychus urticae TaxID=32264 RepID=T1KPV9_TETUR
MRISKYPGINTPIELIQHHLWSKKSVIIQNELTTRAWCKLTEIITCEASDSIVHAVNYYIQSKHPGLKFNWAASTLNPYIEQVDAIKTAIGDDRFIKHVKFYD